MELKLKIYLVNDDGDKFMGIGVLWLLQEISREGSIRSAATNLGISYSKAFSMLKSLESEVGQSVLERKKGGDSREGAVITPFGLRLTALYEDFQRDLKDHAESRFSEFKRALNKEMPDASDPL
jgi:molybdate transport system regulatory protein